MAETAPPFLNDDLVDDRNPWPGLVSFTEEASAFFHGRGEEKAELFRLVARQTLSVVFGQSGLGKTSLLQAGLFPELRRADYLPVYLRLMLRADAPPLASQMLSHLTAAATKAGATVRLPEAGETLWEYFQRIDTALTGPDGRPLTPVMVIDQFEEVFTLGREVPERVDALLGEVECLVENRAPAAVQERFEQRPDQIEQFDFDRRAFKLVLSLREDFLPELESLRNRLRGIAQNRFRLQRMNGRQALAVALEAGGDLIEESAARQVVANLGAGDGAGGDLERRTVEPALLSVVLRELNFRRQQQGTARITPDMVRVAGDILRVFYEDKLSDVPAAARAGLEDSVLSDSGRYRVQAAIEDLEQRGVSRELLDRLVDRRILRYDERYGARVVELSHDRLVPVVQEVREARRDKLAKAEAQQRELAISRKLRRSRLVAAGFALLAAASVVALFFAVSARREADHHLRSAIETANDLSSSLSVAARDEMRVPVAVVKTQIAEADNSLKKMRHSVEDSPELNRVYARFLAMAMETLYRYGELNEGIHYAQQAEQLMQSPAFQRGWNRLESDRIEAYMAYVTGLGQVLHCDYEGGGTSLEQALALLDLDSSPDVETQRLKFHSRLALADLESARLNPAAAIKRIDEAIAGLQNLSAGSQPKDVALLTGQAMLARGGVMLGLDPDQAGEDLAEAQVLLRRSNHANPRSLLGRQLWAELCNTLARTASEQGDAGAAKEHLLQSFNTLEILRKTDPENVAWNHLRAQCWYLESIVLNFRDQPDRLHAAAATALAETVGILDRQPTYFEVKALQARILAKLGNVSRTRYNLAWLAQHSQQQLAREEAQLKEAEAMLQDVVGRTGARSRAATYLVELRRDYAGFLVAQKRWDEAQTKLDEAELAKVEWAALEIDSPGTAMMELDLIIAQAELYREREQFEQAALEYRLALDQAREAMQRWPRRLHWVLRSNLAAYYSGHSNLKLERFDEAVTDYETARKISIEGREHWKKSRHLRDGIAWARLGLSLVQAGKADMEGAVETYAAACSGLSHEISRSPYDESLRALLTYFQSEEAQPHLSDFKKLALGDPAFAVKLDRALATPKKWGRPLADGFTLHPLIPGDWNLLSAAERDAVLDGLAAAGDRPQNQELRSALAGLDVVRMRRIALDCYPDTMLYETLVIGSRHEVAMLSFLHQRREDGDCYVQLKGLSPAIHVFNNIAPLRVKTVEQAEQYLRLFCSAIKGDDGTFRIIDSMEDLYVFDIPQAVHPDEYAHKVRPLELTQDDEGIWRGHVTMAYSNAVFAADLIVQPTGMVIMSDDTPLAADLPVLPEVLDASGLRRTIDPEVQRTDLTVALLMNAQNWAAAAAMLEEQVMSSPTESNTASYVMCLLYLQDHARALGLVDRALGAMTKDSEREAAGLGFHILRAHALLFLNRRAEAEAVYFNPAYFGKNVAKSGSVSGETWELRVVNDFEQFEKYGMTHPAIRALTKRLRAHRRELAKAGKLTPAEHYAAKNEEANEASKAGRYAEAVALERESLALLEENPKGLGGSEDWATVHAGHLLSLSWYQLHAKDFAGALATTETGLGRHPDYVLLETNRAHALLHLGRTAEADAVYLRHRGQRMTQHGDALWDDVIRDDFKKLTAAGVGHPDFARIETLLGGGSSSDQ